jgi:hypothetical protein
VTNISYPLKVMKPVRLDAVMRELEAKNDN